MTTDKDEILLDILDVLTDIRQILLEAHAPQPEMHLVYDGPDLYNALHSDGGVPVPRGEVRTFDQSPTAAPKEDEGLA